ncbi:MAG: tRNA(Ile)(2)-agmatinylcytidine synthase [Candidatus Bathyarchaeota archaeon]|nr:tRNA(Ile)(2)-agmatinylcytidine synthase [Candidatus Bathyarchaeota archaeon]MDH5745925.1 tRNA(Ile)(2)-agmatinylcytidine synthase [Candidatus Bathyarchaeota archaeon]
MTTKTMHIGLDDTDSPKKGCTTYVAALLVEELQKLGAEFIDYPNLVRLNPNVPWKTRGNGALCLRIRYNESHEDEIKETVTSTVEEHADLEYEGTDPGIVFLEKAKIPKEVKIFAKNAITGIVNLKDALKLLKRFKAEAVGFKKCRGIIGGLAAVGETLQGDHTFEVLAYRVPENRGLKRKVDEASIVEMDKATAPYTFNNVDPETGRVLITPRGPDPILFGIRGETPEIVKKAFETVRPLEPVERWVIFRTNQGTDAHLKRVEQLSQIEPYNPVIARGIVAANPKIIPRRHVIFPIKDESAQIDCAAYEPTVVLRKVARKLIVGDHVEIYGGVRAPSQNRPLTINLEKIRLLKLAPKTIHHNPVCPKCGKRLKSMGRNKGFRCEKCGSRYIDIDKIEVKMKREIRRALYITSPRSQRHLTKPFRRYKMEKRHAAAKGLIEGWHFP